MKRSKLGIGELIDQEKDSELICPFCFCEMKIVNIRVGTEFKRRLDKLVCECGYHTIKRNRYEILRDLGGNRMKERDRSIYKIAVLNDLIGLELSKINIKNINNPEAQSKLRNLKKSSDIFTKFTDESFKVLAIQEAFGDFCDTINELIDEQIKQIEE